VSRLETFCSHLNKLIRASKKIPSQQLSCGLDVTLANVWRVLVRAAACARRGSVSGTSKLPFSPGAGAEEPNWEDWAGLVVLGSPGVGALLKQPL